MRNRTAIVGLGLVGTLLAATAIAADPVPIPLTVTLSPAPARDGNPRIATVGVTLAFGAQAVAAGRPVLELPLVVSNVDSVATVLTHVSARDADGPLTLTARDGNAPMASAGDADTGGPMRQWIADRAVTGPLTVQYTVPAAATLPPRGPAPPFAFSDDGAGVSAAGHVFLLLPPGPQRYRMSVDWNLAALPKGARGISSFGEGKATAPEPLSAGEIGMTFYMAGPIGVWPKPVPATGFFAAWQGTPAFDAKALMAWTGTLYGQYSTFFGQTTPPPYGVFLRYNPINAGGGVGLERAFVTTFGRPGGDGSDPADLQMTLAHEMFHTFQPYIAQPAGLGSSWFGEGLATLYQRRLPLRFGLITPDAFLKDLNFHAGRYYSSVMADVPNAEIAKRFWADTRIRTLPYDRGMLYFATIDAAVRQASRGRRSLDDLMLAMLQRERRGTVLTNADWEDQLTRELGARAVVDFRAFLSGQVPLPPSDAFGPCFQRTSVRLRRYDLGFDTAVLAEPQRIVRGLIAGSAAARAGLREGDHIVTPVPQDQLQGTQGRELTLSVMRAGRVFPITYLPRSTVVDTWQWQRVPGIPDSACPL